VNKLEDVKSVLREIRCFLQKPKMVGECLSLVIIGPEDSDVQVSVIDIEDRAVSFLLRSFRNLSQEISKSNWAYKIHYCQTLSFGSRCFDIKSQIRFCFKVKKVSKIFLMEGTLFGDRIFCPLNQIPLD